jgi:hypothetical protein
MSTANKVTIIKKWNSPLIQMKVINEGLELEISLDDFVWALAEEIAGPLVESLVDLAGNPTMWVTKAAAKEKLLEAMSDHKPHHVFLTATDDIVAVIKDQTKKLS